MVSSSRRYNNYKCIYIKQHIPKIYGANMDRISISNKTTKQIRKEIQDLNDTTNY